MYDELVKRLRAAAIMSEALSIFLPHSEGSATAKLYNEAADAIEKLEHQVFLADLACKSEAAKAPRWIPVSERLPEDDSDVLCWYEYYHWSAEKVLPEYGIGQWCNGIWGGEVSNGRDCKVLSWMPLPEPPKEEQA